MHIKKIFQFTDYDIYPVFLAKLGSGFDVMDLEIFTQSKVHMNPEHCIPGKLYMYYGPRIYRQ